jgi:hypothetical protein
MPNMSVELVYSYLERIANLLSPDARRAGSGKALFPSSWLEAPHYLAVCNRYSNTPTARNGATRNGARSSIVASLMRCSQGE